MENSKNLSKTLYILCIATNARYKCSNNDSEEFNQALKIYRKNVPSSSPLGLEGESYSKSYICGMYPEFEKALEYFRDKTFPIQATGKLIPDDELIRLSNETIQKFGLEEAYDFSQEPNIIQKKRLNSLILPKAQKDISNLAPEALRELGLSFSETCQDFRLVLNFMKQFNIISDTVATKQNEEDLSEFTHIKGISLAIKLLNLKDQGIIDSDLNILDHNRFSDSKVVKEFQFEDKTYDLSLNLPHKEPVSKSSISYQNIQKPITR